MQQPVIIPINPDIFAVQDYTFEDFTIVPNFEVTSSFITTTDYVEYFIYDGNNTLLTGSQLVDYTFTEDPGIIVSGGYATMDIDPSATLVSNGYDVGVYNIVYNFFQNELGSSPTASFFIKDISSDRTELRLSSNAISGSTILETYPEFDTQLSGSSYFDGFYLNFGDNKVIIAVNSQLEGTDVLIKLYEALPEQFVIKSTCWVVTKVADPIAYNVSFISEIIPIANDVIFIQGPNTNLQIQDEISNSTSFKSYADLVGTTLTSSFQQVQSLLEEKGIDINIEYASGSTMLWENFIQFSSGEQRVKNFYEKLSLIQGFQDDLNEYIFSITGSTSSSYYTSASQGVTQTKINNLIKNFDDFEYFLYYTSGSTSWPKTNSQPPFILANTGSVAGLGWLSTYTGSGAIFDNENQNNLIYTIPEYIRNDSANESYILFVEMMGQNFDNIWVYLKDVTNKFDADNRINFGISKDLVAQAIRDFGLKIYQNNFSQDSLYTAFLGISPSGSLITNTLPGTTGTLPVPTGSGLDYVTSYVTASNELIPQDDTNKMLYKRLYHNIPYLLKKKGTPQAIRTLIASYGIPSTELRISEFGGKDRDNTNDWDYWYERFNYALTSSGNNYVSSSWGLNSVWGAPDNVPATLEFRFKTNGLPTSSIPFSQSLWSLNSGGGTSAITLKYTGSAYTTGSYSGSVVNPYYQYAKLDFYPNTSNLNSTASVYLPFFDGEWWSVMLTRDNNDYNLYAKNNIYLGDDSAQIGYQASSSLVGTDSVWTGSNGISYLGTGSLASYNMFSGSFQELRYYNIVLNEESFDAFVMDPNSIGGNSLNGAPDQLAFRASLGGELYTSSISIHPKITGSWVATSSFASNSGFNFNVTPYFEPNTEQVFLLEPIAGLRNRVNDKVRIVDEILPTGDTLSAYISIQQNSPVSQSYTPDLNQLEVAFSPQNEINDDITAQLPGFNLGEFIGDPRQISSSATSYPALDALRNSYFQKYTSNYDANDYIRLIKFFDNSLFKMIKDFVPARTSLISGVVIKQHLLERNKYPVPQVDISSSIAFGVSGSTDNGSYSLNVPIGFQDITITASIGSTRGLLDGQTIYTASSNYESIPLETITGSQGGAYADLSASYQFRPVTSSTGQKYLAEYGSTIADSIGLNITQSWLGFNTTPFGLTSFTQSNAQEFFNGELSGSNLVVEDGDLNGGNPFLNVNTTPILYDLVTRNPASTVTYFTASLAVFDSTTAKQNCVDFLLTRIPGDGLMQAAFTFQPSGSKTGTITTTVLGTGSDPGGNGSNVLYLDKINAIGSVGMGNGTLIPLDSNFQFKSASTSDSSPGPFYDVGFTAQSNRGWASPYVGGTSPFFGMSPTNDPPKDILLIDSNITGALIIPDQYPSFVFGISSSVAIGQPITLYFEIPLQYNFVGVTVNNTDDTGIDYTTLWQQCEAITMNWVDKTGTTVAVGSYQGGQPTPLAVAPLSPTRTAVYVIGNPVSIVGLESGDNAPFNTTSSLFSNQNYPVITSPGVNVDFTYNEFNALIDNAVETAGAPGFYDLDYTQGGTVPVNYQAVISASQLDLGFSTLAPIQSYNWNVRRSVLPRYSGSKMISALYNVFTPGDQSFGKEPVINYYGNIVFNVDFVQGTYPEMAKGTSLNVKSIGIFQDPSKTEIIDQNTPSTFNFLLDQYLGYNQPAEIFSNDLSPIKDNNIITANGQIGFPANSIYFIPRQQTFGAGSPYNFSGSWVDSTRGGLVFYGTGFTPASPFVMKNQVVDDNDRYATGSSFDTVYSASILISQSLEAGNKFFVTLYSASAYPLPTFEEYYVNQLSLIPFNSGSNIDHSAANSLATQGVYEIASVSLIPSGSGGFGNGMLAGTTASFFQFKTGSGYEVPETRPLGTDGQGNISVSQSLSALIWQANPFPQPVILEIRSDYFPSGIGERGGYVIPVDFNVNMKSSLSVLQNTTITPQVTSTGTTTVSLPIAPGTGGATTTGAAPTQNTNLFLPVGRSGISNGEQVNVGNQIYIWNQGNQTWVLSPSSGGSGTSRPRK
jgi:hypothetical protein